MFDKSQCSVAGPHLRLTSVSLLKEQDHTGLHFILVDYTSYTWGSLLKVCYFSPTYIVLKVLLLSIIYTLSTGKIAHLKGALH